MSNLAKFIIFSISVYIGATVFILLLSIEFGGIRYSIDGVHHTFMLGFSK